jgi:hypothetical protein
MSNKADDFASWGESIKDYRAEKSGAYYSPGDTPAVVTHYQKQREERLYNPVLCKFRDADIEQAYKTQENAFLDLTLKEAQCKKLSTGCQPFNIVNNKTKVEDHSRFKSENSRNQKYKQRHAMDSRTGYNVVSNKNSRGDDKSNFTQQLPYTQPRSDARDFSIINNKYNKSNSHKQQIDKEADRALNAKRIAMQCDYNPVQGVFYSTSKELQYRQAVEDQSKVQGLAQASRYPPSVQLSEGLQYDIVQLQPKDMSRAPPLLAQASQDGQLLAYQSEPSIRILQHAQEENWKRGAYTADAKRQDQARNRFSRTGNRTYLDMKAQGYDMISGAVSRNTSVHNPKKQNAWTSRSQHQSQHHRQSSSRTTSRTQRSTSRSMMSNSSRQDTQRDRIHRAIPAFSPIKQAPGAHRYR